MPTIRDVARACGLSAMTVSSVLNGKTGEASEETRAKVLKTVDELGYHPNGVARGLARRRMDTLGIVASFSDRPSLFGDRYFGPIFDGLLLGAQKYHQRALIITEDTWDELPRHLSRYLDGHCDGLIFVTPTFCNEVIAPLIATKLPIVFLGENRPELPISVVDMDNVHAGELATTKLIEAGHQRIAYLGGDSELRSSHERRQGYCNALSRKNLSMATSFIVCGHYSEASGYREASLLLNLPKNQRPTAFFCGDDAIAIGAIHAIHERGALVPQDFSVVGINDDQIAALSHPPLTTIRQPLWAEGEHAIRILLEQIQSEKHSPQQVLLPGEWVERGTVGPPPAQKGGTKL
ncbi:MAG: LacI family DNA-binding transcriptional regulator [Armatimonadetes bacterium]|nr:LacI family DNA-binding transcriptional regulator [Armatimonadota bacterium]